ncbi:MAG: dihydrodipicolinate synthase family protein [Planctomycetota bacterium]|nr:dihydrodipicolinate synthase family protein [Planctomycetota bacterium]
MNPNPHRAFARTLKGPLVPVLAAFHDDERLDIDSTCRWVDWQIRSGIKLFWTTHGTTHFMSLTDREVMDLTAALAQVVHGRGTLIASTPRHWATNACIEFTEFAAKAKADVVKVQVDWNFTFSSNQLVEHYQAVAARSPLPLFAYAMGSAAAYDESLRRIIAIPQFIGAKNDSDDFYGQERFLASVRQLASPEEFLVMCGGGLSSVALTYDLGQRAYGDMTPWYSPALSVRLHEAFQKGDRKLINRFLIEIEEPLFFNTWPGIGHWGWGHAIAYHLGLFKSYKMRFPSLTLKADDVAQAKTFLDKIASWG